MDTSTGRDDLALMAAMAGGEQAALAELYDRYSPLVYGVCLRVLRDAAEAEEVMVDVFQEAWERAGRYDAGRACPRTFLLLLARSRAIDRGRSRKRGGAALVDGQVLDQARVGEGPRSRGDGPLEETVLVEQRARVREALKQLNPVLRQAVELAFLDGLSHSQIAEKLGRPLGSVKTNIRQGLIQLRDALRTYYWDSGSDGGDAP